MGSISPISDPCLYYELSDKIKINAHKRLTILSSVAPVEATVINGSHSVLGGAMEKTSLVVLVTISHLHVTLLNL